MLQTAGMPRFYPLKVLGSLPQRSKSCLGGFQLLLSGLTFRPKVCAVRVDLYQRDAQFRCGRRLDFRLPLSRWAKPSTLRLPNGAVASCLMMALSCSFGRRRGGIGIGRTRDCLTPIRGVTFLRFIEKVPFDPNRPPLFIKLAGRCQIGSALAHLTVVAND